MIIYRWHCVQRCELLTALLLTGQKALLGIKRNHWRLAYKAWRLTLATKVTFMANLVKGRIEGKPSKRQKAS